MENSQLTDEEKVALDVEQGPATPTANCRSTRGRTALFKKLTRYLFTCQFCMRSTDVMAYDKEDAGKRIAEKKWKVMKVTLPKKDKTEKQKVTLMLACKRCSKALEDAEKARNN